jgi:hypothetical protein
VSPYTLTSVLAPAISSVRRLSAIKSIFKSTDPGFYTNNENDTHTDTCVCGTTFTVVEDTAQVCDVSPFSNEYQAMKDMPIISAATTYTNPTNGESVILLVNQALWFRKAMPNSLFSPNHSYGTTASVFQMTQLTGHSSLESTLTKPCSYLLPYMA